MVAYDYYSSLFHSLHLRFLLARFFGFLFYQPGAPGPYWHVYVCQFFCFMRFYCFYTFGALDNVVPSPRSELAGTNYAVEW